MTLIELIQLLQQLDKQYRKKVFTLKELSILSKESAPTTAMTLLRAQKKSLVTRIGNLWVNLLNPPELLEIALALPYPSYLSFESALYHHGILSQAPRGGLTMATSARSCQLQTQVGNIHFIHLKSELFFGFDEHRIAYPEKAYLDCLYLRGIRTHKPQWTESIDRSQLKVKAIKKMIQKFPDWMKKNTAEDGY